MPPDSPLYGDDTTNNFLEFLALAVNTWLHIVELGPDATEECMLPLADNTSALGWLFRSGRLDKDSKYFTPVQLVARHLATVILNSGHCLAGQHLAGEHNIVADLLSFAGNQRGYPYPLAPDFPDDETIVAQVKRLVS